MITKITDNIRCNITISMIIIISYFILNKLNHIFVNFEYLNIAIISIITIILVRNILKKYNRLNIKTILKIITYVTIGILLILFIPMISFMLYGGDQPFLKN